MISRIEATREITWGYKSYRVSCYSVADASRLNPEHGDTGIAIYTSVLGFARLIDQNDETNENMETLK